MLRVFFVVLLGLLIIQPTFSYAEHYHRRYHSHVGFHFDTWPDRYYYDPYYYPYYSRPYYRYVVVSEPTYQPVVSESTYQPIVVNGTTYYLNNGVYYLYTQYGYQAVPKPAGAASSVKAEDSADTFTINVPNDKGGYVPVVIKKSGEGYVGPQGEFYTEFPKVSQLKAMYGK